jgi:hypothetical protein
MGGRWGHWRVIGGNYACSSSEDANLTRPLLNCPKDPALAARSREQRPPGWSLLAVRPPFSIGGRMLAQDEWHIPKLC